MNRPPNMQQIMKQAQKMQAYMLAAQEQLAAEEFTGSAGGGAVTAVVTGAARVVRVDITPEVIDPSDPEMLGDLVVAAVNAALDTASAATNDRLGGLAGGLGGLGGLLG